MSTGATVFIVDDDAAVRDALTRLFKVAGHEVESYPDAEAFLAAYNPPRLGCLVLDLHMPGLGGLGLQAVLAERMDCLPIIFLTGQGTVPATVRALKGGAVDFLEKPAEGGALLACVRRALQRDAERRRNAAARNEARARCATLTEREHELLPLVAAGRSNKDIARQLGISYRTVEQHRNHILHKTGAKNAIELATIIQAGGLSRELTLGDPVNTPKMP